MTTHNTCSLSGCRRQAIRSRLDGLCHEHGESRDEQDDVEDIKASLRRDETPETASIVRALLYLLGERS